jgi:hypothetical protein
MPLPYHIGTGHNCPLEAQVRITTQMNGCSFLQGEALFDMIRKIKWTK